jgi:Abnormal spindle-like microcephaly-assoc'd, ASPM-SPD-2-Hydin
MKKFVAPMLVWICVASACSSSMPGTALSPALTLSASSVMFGQEIVGQPSSAQTVTLTNTGTGALQITSIVVSASFEATNDCMGSVAAGASCTINVTFTPVLRARSTEQLR